MSLPLTGLGGVGSAPSPLFSSLQDYYKLDEASGDALDAIGANNLTAQNAPTSVAGIISTARNFNTNLASAQFFSASSGLAALKFLQTTFAIGLWFKVDQNFINNQTNKNIFTKANLVTGVNWAWALVEDIVNTGTIYWACSAAGTFATSTQVAPVDIISPDVWNYVVVYRNFGVEIGISLNGSIYEVASYTGNIADTASAVNLGPSTRTQAVGNMAVDEIAIWTGFIPSQNQLDWLYNAGAGRALSEYASGPAI